MASSAWVYFWACYFIWFLFIYSVSRHLSGRCWDEWSSRECHLRACPRRCVRVCTGHSTRTRRQLKHEHKGNMFMIRLNSITLLALPVHCGWPDVVDFKSKLSRICRFIFLKIIPFYRSWNFLQFRFLLQSDRVKRSSANEWKSTALVGATCRSKSLGFFCGRTLAWIV